MAVDRLLLKVSKKVVTISWLLGLFSGCSLPSHRADVQLVDDIVDRIERKTTFSKKLRVSAEHGKVAVSGVVNTPKQVEYLSHIISETPGVKSITNNIVVEPVDVNHDEIERSEHNSLSSASKNYKSIVSEPLLHHIRNKIKQDIDSEKYNILIASSEGKIVLSGEVESAGTAQHILNITQNAAQEIEIQNLMYIKKVPDAAIRNQVAILLSEFPPFVTNGLSFTVDNGVVSYFGEVDNHEDIDAVLSQTLMLNGVKSASSSVSYPK